MRQDQRDRPAPPAPPGPVQLAPRAQQVPRGPPEAVGALAYSSCRLRRPDIPNGLWLGLRAHPFSRPSGAVLVLEAALVAVAVTVLQEDQHLEALLLVVAEAEARAEETHRVFKLKSG